MRCSGQQGGDKAGRDGHRQGGDGQLLERADGQPREHGDNADAEGEVFEPPFDKVRGGSRAQNEAKENERMKAFFRDSEKVKFDFNDSVNSLFFIVNILG